MTARPNQPAAAATSSTITSMLGVLALTVAAGTAAAPTLLHMEQQAGTAPVCRHASHERLIVKAGRDVCGATLNAAGQPTARGFLPTECAIASDEYRIDAEEAEDRCTAVGTKTTEEEDS